jgi:hypothetical protein
MRLSTRSMSGGHVSSACRLSAPSSIPARAAGGQGSTRRRQRRGQGLNDVEEASHDGASGLEYVAVIRPAPVIANDQGSLGSIREKLGSFALHAKSPAAERL